MSSDSKNSSDIDNEQPVTNESRKQGGSNFLTQEHIQSTLAVVENQNSHELRQALINFLLQFIARALDFVISLLSSTFAWEQIFPQASDSQPRLRLTDSLTQRMRRCTHPAHKQLHKTALIHQIPTAYFELLLQDNKKDKRLLRNNVSKSCDSLNTSIIERLRDIDHKAPDNVELKLLNYQEWVDMLLKINKVLLINLSELEAELLSSLKNAESLKAYRADTRRLIELILRAETEGCWSFDEYVFETFEAEKIFSAHKYSEVEKEAFPE